MVGVAAVAGQVADHIFARAETERPYEVSARFLQGWKDVVGYYKSFAAPGSGAFYKGDEARQLMQEADLRTIAGFAVLELPHQRELATTFFAARAFVEVIPAAGSKKMAEMLADSQSDTAQWMQQMYDGPQGSFARATTEAMLDPRSEDNRKYGMCIGSVWMRTVEGMQKGFSHDDVVRGFFEMNKNQRRKALKREVKANG